MKTVLVFGAFDGLHPGHRWFLGQAAALGDRLIAVVARDKFITQWKGKTPMQDEVSRLETLQTSRLVDKAILADEQIHTYSVLKTVKPDIICLGHDQTALHEDIVEHIKKFPQKEYKPGIHITPPWKRSFYNSTRINKVFRQRTWWLYALMILAMLTYGFSWVSGKRLTVSAGPGTLAFLRFVGSSIIFLPLFIGKMIHIRRWPSGNGLLWVLPAALSLASYSLLYFFGLHASLAGKGGVIVTTMNPLFTFFITSVLAGIRRMAVVGVILGVFAGIILVEPWNYSLGELSDTGNLVFMGAALLWSALTIFARKAQSVLGFRQFNFFLYTLAAVLSLPFALLESGGKISLDYNLDFWLDMLFISVISSAFGSGMYFYTTTKLGAARTSAFTYLVPASTFFFAWLLLGEIPSLAALLGGLLAVLAFTLIHTGQSR